jgi:hypothetical protein
MANLLELLDNDFDDKAVKPSTGIPEPVPPGKYTLQVEKAETSYTKSGTGIILKASMAILGGEYDGRMIFANFNIRNASAIAQTIGISELKALVAACGLDWETVREESDLMLYKPFVADVGMEKQNINESTGQPYPPRNRVTKYHMKDAGAPAIKNPAPTTPGMASPKPPTMAKPVGKDEIPF